MENYKKQIQKQNKSLKDQFLKQLKNKEDPKKLGIKTRKYFSLKKTLATHLLKQLENSQFLVGDQPWGENSFRKDISFYLAFYEEYNDKNFKKKIFDLLTKAKNKTPQSGKDRKTNYYKSGGDFETDLPGKEIVYSNKHNSNYQHQFTYCNKTKIDFFKGSNNDAKQIIKLGFDKLFSYSFIYGYLEAALNIIFKIGLLDSAFYDPLHIPRKKPKLVKFSSKEEKKYDKEFIKDIKIQFFKKFYKFPKSKSEKIINDIEKSIFESKLSQFLLTKKEDYFITQEREITDYKNKDGSADFLLKIRREDEDEFKYIEDLRIKKILNLTRKKQNIPRGFYHGKDMSLILNFEQFRFYTLHTPYLEIYNSKELNIDEEDLLIRYAVYMGVQEIQFFIHHKIFGGF